MLEFRGDAVASERIYVMEGWEAPERRVFWRAELQQTRRSEARTSPSCPVSSRGLLSRTYPHGDTTRLRHNDCAIHKARAAADTL